MEQFWRIGDFAKEVGKHTNTVDSWFKQLEEKRIHYVNRAANEKVYDYLDLQIAGIIRDRRDSKPAWALDAIYEDLTNQVELRPFPEDYGNTSGSQVMDLDGMRRLLMQEMAATMEDIVATRIQEGVQEVIKQLPPPTDPTKERQQRLDEHFAQRRVLRVLEDEGIHLWSTKPDSERLKKVGIFKKEENVDARDRFVRKYIDENYEARMIQAYGIENDSHVKGEDLE